MAFTKDEAGGVTAAAPGRPSLPDAVIYFGHQSVGGNILDGIRDLVGAGPDAALPIEEISSHRPGKRPLLIHSWLGENRNPQSKIDTFVTLMESDFGAEPGIAFFKFCYVDVTAGTDPDELFSRYRSAMERLRSRRPGVAFVHFTVPLTTNLSLADYGKNLVKRILGRPLKSQLDNVRRARFNELTRVAYGGRESLFLFDLARLESTRLDGTREVFQDGGREYEALVPAYTDDGGHLNEAGRKIVAEALLGFLARIPRGAAG